MLASVPSCCMRKDVRIFASISLQELILMFSIFFFVTPGYVQWDVLTSSMHSLLISFQLQVSSCPVFSLSSCFALFITLTYDS